MAKLSLVELKECAKGLTKSIAESQWKVSCAGDKLPCQRSCDTHQFELRVWARGIRLAGST
jgi:hypothetical protein